MPTQYEAVNKKSGIAYPVDQMTFGDGWVETLVRGEILHFKNDRHEVDLQNDEWYLRQIGSHIATDGITNTDEAGVITPAPEATEASETNNAQA